LPINCLISTELNLAYARWSGCVDLDEFREMFAAYLEDKNYLLGRPELCDFSEFTDMDVNFRQIWSALSMVNVPEKLSVCKTQCIIYAPGDTAFGLARMYKSLAEYEGGVQVTVCREETEALTALNLVDSTIEEMRRRGNFQQLSPILDQVSSSC
jgi:hypothetical protein